jgi:glycosyltransferase involved in cell wall biosynthesis
MRRVAIDLVPIRPGQGGSGSGIWTYARELVTHLDALEPDSRLQLFVLINRDQDFFFSGLRHLRVIRFPAMGSLWRLIWIHLWLPLWCAWHRIDGLHKLASETPAWCGATRITTVHDFFHEFRSETEGKQPGWASRYFSWITRLALRKSAHIITGSEAVADEIRRRYPQVKAPITPIYHGVVSGGDAGAGATDGGTLLCVAKLMPYKGQMQALEGVAALLARRPELRGAVHLVLHGFENDEAYVQALDARARQPDLAGHVERRAYRLDASLPEIYAGVAVALFLTSYEGFGLPLIEAQALGVPVVCSDIAVLREVGGESPWYVDRDNPEAVATAVLEALQPGDKRNARMAVGRANSQRFRWEKTAQKTRAVYARALNTDAEVVYE